MKVNTSKEFKDQLPLGGDMLGVCLLCGQPVWDNTKGGKKSEASPDFKCKNKDECGAPFWIDKPKQPAHQLKPKQNGINESGVLIILAQIAEEIREIKTLIANALNKE